MKLEFLIIAYIIFTWCNMIVTIRETIKNERELINQGNKPLGDSTYIIYGINIITRTLLGLVAIFSIGNIHILLDNILLFTGIVLGLYIVLELISALIGAVAIFFINMTQENKLRKNMDEKADSLTENLWK